jgi:hypothetical protein
MNILIDYHHEAAHLARHLVFTRLGHKLFVPYGLEWYESGILTFDTVEQAKQFLINGANKEKGTAAVHSNDPTFPYPKFNYLTYPEFLDLGIDLIIFSRKESVDNGSFKKLKILKPQTKRGFMSGNYKCVFATAPGFFEQHCVENYLTSCKVAYW